MHILYKWKLLSVNSQDVSGTFTHSVAMVMIECPALGVEVNWLHAKDVQQFVSIKQKGQKKEKK